MQKLLQLLNEQPAPGAAEEDVPGEGEDGLSVQRNQDFLLLILLLLLLLPRLNAACLKNPDTKNWELQPTPISIY